MITTGVDLATEPQGTAACQIDWLRGEVTLVTGELDDGALIELILAADFTAIDVPFGWPDAFVEALQSHRAGEWVDVPRSWLDRRLTDEVVRGRTRIKPLSVSANLIGSTAMRGARLQHLLRARGSR